VERGICPIAAVCTVLFYCPDVKPKILNIEYLWLSLKYPGRDLDLEVTWRSWSPDHTIRYVQVPICVVSEL